MNGYPKYRYKEVEFTWEEDDVIREDGVVLDKNGQPYFRGLTRKEKKERISEFPILSITGNISLNENKLPVDEKNKPITKIVTVPLTVMEVTSVVHPDYVLKSLERGKLEFPKNLDLRMCKFILPYIQDYTYHSMLSDFLNEIPNIKRLFDLNVEDKNKEENEEDEDDTKLIKQEQQKVIKQVEQQKEQQKVIKQVEQQKEQEQQEQKEKEIEIQSLNIAMINYSFNLGMHINRWELCRLIDNYKKFTASYDNTKDHHVTITRKYFLEKQEDIKRKCDQISFMVYKSGVVTISGPSTQLMSKPYYDFMNFVYTHYKEINLSDGNPIKFKISKSFSETFDDNSE